MTSYPCPNGSLKYYRVDDRRSARLFKVATRVTTNNSSHKGSAGITRDEPEFEISGIANWCVLKMIISFADALNTTDEWGISDGVVVPRVKTVLYATDSGRVSGYLRRKSWKLNLTTPVNASEF
jgi:hypothetical protein